MRFSFGRLNKGSLYLRHPVDVGGDFADVNIEKKPAKVHQSRPKSLCLRCVLWLIELVLIRVHLWLILLCLSRQLVR
jgi:hypothetical protein